MKESEKLLNYLKVPSVQEAKAIPTKNQLTFIAKMDDLPQAWTLDRNHNPVPFGTFSDRVMSVHHSPQGDQAVIGVDDQGNEKQQLYLMTNNSSFKQKPLVVEPEFFHHFGDWSPDGQSIVFSSNRRHPGYFDIFIMDVTTKDMRKIFTYDGNCIPLKWLKDEKHILISIQETNIDQAIYMLNIYTSHITRLGAENRRARYQSVQLTKDAQGGYILTDLGEETLYISQLSFDQPHDIKKLVHHPTWDIEEISLSPDETMMIYTLNEGGISRLYIYDIKKDQTKAIKDVPDGVIHSLSWVNDETCIFTLKTPTIPGDIWQLNIGDEKVERLTHISHSHNVGHLWVKPTLQRYTSFDGLDVPYFLYYKDDTNRRPAVVWVHGGPESQTRAAYNPVIQYLVEQGFVVVAPNVRGSRGYGRTYIQLDDRRKRMDAVKDLAWLHKDLIQTHGVDKNRVGIIGRSYGGFMVLASLTHYPDLWRAGVNIVGISHFKTFLQNTGPWRRRLREFEYGSLEHDVDFFEDIAPFNHTHYIKAPLLMFHGENDTRVPVSEAKQLVENMKAQNKDVSLTVFPDEGHQTVKLKNHIMMNRQIVQFMIRHLT